MITIDGKKYPLWSQFVGRKEEWIGGILEEFGDGFSDGGTTVITDITLEKEDDDVYFSILGKDFSETFAVDCGGISGGQHEDDWLHFSSICSNFRIKRKKDVSSSETVKELNL